VLSISESDKRSIVGSSEIGIRKIEFLTFCEFVFCPNRFFGKSILRAVSPNGREKMAQQSQKGASSQFVALLSHFLSFAQ